MHQFRDMFPGSFRLSDAEIAILWDSALFVLDANVLLNVYRYSPVTKQSLVTVLDAIKSRIWIPFQAADEFQRNRLQVIAGQVATYESTAKNTKTILDALNASRSHPFVSEETLKETQVALSSLLVELGERQKAHEMSLNDDSDLKFLALILDGKIGAEPGDQALKELRESARKRLDQKIPPGYRDKKPDDRDLGDAILWLQTLEHSTKLQLPVILVTDDGKDDWWEIVRGKTLAPRSEIIKEFRTLTKQSFHMYSPSQFIEHASNKFGIKINSAIIDEVESVSAERAVDNTISSTTRRSESRLNANLLSNYLAERFPQRGEGTIEEYRELSSELRKSGVRNIQQLDRMITKYWKSFSSYESTRSRTGQRKFYRIGVACVINRFAHKKKAT